MDRARRAILVFVLLLFVLMAAGFGVALLFKQRRLSTETQRPSGPVPIVVTTPVKAFVERTTTISGTLMPEAEVTVVAKSTGEITAKRISLGDRVKSGQTLYRIDDEVYLAQKNQADAAVKQAMAAAAMANAAYDQAQTEYGRAKRLYQSGSATQQMLDQAQAGYLQARAALEQAAAGLKQAAAAADLARIALENCNVTSPIDGFVAGDFQMDLGDTAIQGIPLVRIVDKRILKASAPLPGRLLSEVQEGRTRVHIQVEGYAETIEATLTTMNPAVDPIQRAATMECVFTNPSDGEGRLLLSPGSFARMHVVLEREEGLVVPASAIIHRDRGDFVVVENEALHLSPAELGDFRRIFSRLEPQQKDGETARRTPSVLASGRLGQARFSLPESAQLVLPRAALLTGEDEPALAVLKDNEIRFIPVRTEPLKIGHAQAAKYFGRDVPLVCVCTPLPDSGNILLPDWALAVEPKGIGVVVLRDRKELDTVPTEADWLERSNRLLGIHVAECRELAPAGFFIHNGRRVAVPACALIREQSSNYLIVSREGRLRLVQVQTEPLDSGMDKAYAVPEISGEWLLADLQLGRDEQLMLPRQAVVSIQDATLVSTISDHRMLLAPVRLGLTSSTRVIVRTGLNADSLIMKEGVLYAYDGAEVNVVGETVAKAGEGAATSE